MTHITADLKKTIRETLEKEQEQIQNSLSNLKRDDPFNDPSRTEDNASADTDAFEDSEHLRIETQANELRLQLMQIEEALGSIAKGTYGVCTSCGAAIDKNRLLAIPATKVCITCEQKNS